MSKKVAILMGCFNGGRYLGEQLTSLKEQTHKEWVLYARDDCSTDNTVDILENFSKENPEKIYVTQNKSNIGVSKNFLSLICDKGVDADHFSFCDQDDYWYPDKIARGLNHLKKTDQSIPAIYYSSLELVDKKCQHKGFISLLHFPLNFKNALIQNCLCGNTLLLNPAARKIICESVKNSNAGISIHDWWTYLIIAGCGSQIVYDSSPSLKYRHHGRNHFLKSFIGKIFALFSSSRYPLALEQNIKVLMRNEHLLTEKKKEILERFIELKNHRSSFRKLRMFKEGYRRYGRIENLVLATLVLPGKV